MFKASMRGSEEDWWFKFQNEKTGGSLTHVPGENRIDDQSKRTLVKRFLHSSMYKVKERVEPQYNYSQNTFKASASTAGTIVRSSDQSSLISRSQITKSLRSCASSARVFEGKPLNVSSKRIVSIGCPTVNTSMATTVALVCGGGLEKVHFRAGPKPTVEIHFLSPDNAAKFYEYSKRNTLLAINGYPLTVKWAASSDGWEPNHEPLAPYVTDEVEKFRATRVIVLTRPVVKKAPAGGTSRGYPDPRDNYSPDFNIEKVKWDFVQFGGIVEVTPMVSSKLSISIQYTDIRSAILVMHAMTSKSSFLYSKYSQWSFRYGRDVTNRPCLAV